jgi:hypothetical protein
MASIEQELNDFFNEQSAEEAQNAQIRAELDAETLHSLQIFQTHAVMQRLQPPEDVNILAITIGDLRHSEEPPLLPLRAERYIALVRATTFIASARKYSDEARLDAALVAAQEVVLSPILERAEMRKWLKIIEHMGAVSLISQPDQSEEDELAAIDRLIPQMAQRAQIETQRTSIYRFVSQELERFMAQTYGQRDVLQELASTIMLRALHIVDTPPDEAGMSEQSMPVIGKRLAHRLAQDYISGDVVDRLTHNTVDRLRFLGYR